jgi:hypothetical protein
MANETEPGKTEKGFLSKAWKAHGTVAKYVGVFGIPAMFGFLPKAATIAKAADPAAGLFDIFTTLWGMMGSTIAEFAIPGGSIVLGEIGNLATGAFNAVANAAAIAPTAMPMPTPG